MNEYNIIRITPNHLSDLVFLFNSIHKEKASLEYFIQKFNTEYTGAAYVGYLAYDTQNKACAYYGVFPCILSLNGQRLLGAQSGDTMTHPDHQRKGLFYNLAAKTYELCKELGIKYIFGIPNFHNSYPGLLKLNWKYEGDMIVNTIKTKPDIFIKILRKLNRELFRKKVRSIINKYTNASNDAWNLNNITDFYPIKDSDFLNYKLKVNRYVLSFPEGECIVQINDFEFIVGDFEISDMKKKDEFWERLIKLASKIGADSISFHCTKNIIRNYILPANTIVQKGLPVTTLNLLLKQDPPSISLTGFDYDTF